MKAYLAVLIVLGLQMSALPAADKKEAPKPLPPEIVQVWRDAGANIGWMNMNLHLILYAARNDALSNIWNFSVIREAMSSL